MLRLDIDIVIILISLNFILVKQHYLCNEFVGIHRISLVFFFFPSRIEMPETLQGQSAIISPSKMNNAKPGM